MSPEETKAPYTVRWGDLDSETVTEGLERQVVHGDRQTMVRYVYQPGSVFPDHRHVEEQITVVLSGRIRFTVGKERFECGPGSCAVIPGGMPHSADVIGDQVVETLNAYSPRRDSQPKLCASSGSLQPAAGSGP